MDTLNRHLDARELRRFKCEERASEKLDRQIDASEPLIGELIRDGKIVFYVWPRGGRYREGSRFELVQFLIRNHYV